MRAIGCYGHVSRELTAEQMQEAIAADARGYLWRCVLAVLNDAIAEGASKGVISPLYDHWDRAIRGSGEDCEEVIGRLGLSRYKVPRMWWQTRRHFRLM